ncbi:jg12064 [Pararge aegeria aegeria]|uniref:Jg12064 protein n=1 Tax=Pararge aegeria aegeria TaxID=348720 RepID=A0A8S4RHY6_9NEOP|nr:jg12064 [Pararge aegeria aegeria]
MGLIRRLRVIQRAMERAMLGVSLRDTIRNVEIRRRTRVNDITQRVTKLKWQWAGRIVRREGWTLGSQGAGMAAWYCTAALVNAATVGRPPTRRTGDIRRVAGSRWIQSSQNRRIWNSLQKTYVQQWTSIG